MTSAIGMNRAVKGRYAKVGASSGSATRISVRANVLVPYGDLDENDMPVARRVPQRRAPRTQSAVPMPRHERPARGGMTLITALCITGIFVFTLGIVTLVNMSRLTEASKALFTLRTQIEAGQKANNELAMQLDAASDGAKICYAAARNLGMVAAEGAELVYLTAPSTRHEIQEVQAAVPPARSGIYGLLFGFLD